MNPTAKSTTDTAKPNGMTSDQKTRLDNVMSVPASQASDKKAEPSPFQTLTGAAGTTNPISASTTLNPTVVMPPTSGSSSTPQPTYNAPTLSPAVSTVNPAATQHSKTNKNQSGGSTNLKLILFVVLGIILLVAYIVIWAFIFNFTLPISVF